MWLPCEGARSSPQPGRRPYGSNTPIFVITVLPVFVIIIIINGTLFVILVTDNGLIWVV